MSCAYLSTSPSIGTGIKINMNKERVCSVLSTMYCHEQNQLVLDQSCNHSAFIKSPSESFPIPIQIISCHVSELRQSTFETIPLYSKSQAGQRLISSLKVFMQYKCRAFPSLYHEKACY